MVATTVTAAATTESPDPSTVAWEKRSRSLETTKLLQHKQQSSSSSSTSSSNSSAPFRAKSLALGNGWNAKGLSKAQAGKWDHALVCWENALHIRLQVDANSIDIANSYNNMGIALGRLDRLPEAQAALERALHIRSTTRDAPEIATALHNLGNVHGQAQQWPAAIQCFRQARDLQECLGMCHPHRGRTCVALGAVQAQAGQYQNAQRAYRQALHIFEQAGIPKDDEEVQTVQRDLRVLIEESAHANEQPQPQY